MSEVPGHQIINLVKRCKGNVNRVGDVLAMENASGNISVGENCDFIRQLDLFEWSDELEIRTLMWFRNSFNCPSDEWRDHSPIIVHLVFPPANCQIATKGLTVVQVSTNH